MEHLNVIELNGKRYDALTGKLLGVSHTAAIPAVRSPRGKVIDGFIAPTRLKVVAKPAPHRPTAPVAVATSKHVSHPAAPAQKTTAHSIASHVPAHQPERASTLMRHAVHKPEAKVKPSIKKVQSPSEVVVRSGAVALKHSAYQVDRQRLARSQQASTHSAVRRFQPHHMSTAEHATNYHAPVTPSVPIIAVKPTPKTLSAPSKPVHKDIFEAAIAHANSHEQPAPRVRRSRKRRLANTLAGMGAFLVIGGFIAYLNMPNIELRVASIQAGFGAQIPDYRPTGFAMRGGVQRAGNTVSMKFQSGDQSYTITQQPSTWNSQTLVENTLALGGEHEVVQAGGRTIYVYGKENSNAVWVDGNVRYDVTGNARFSSDDIVSLATSL